jgi:fatty-acyl-CoA synthase
MRFQLFAARTAFAALFLAALAGAGAVAGVRLGLLTDKGGSTLMIPATVLGLAALALALLWLRSALARNENEGRLLGLIALLGSLAFLYSPITYVYYGYKLLPIHDIATAPEDPPQFVVLARIHPANGRAFDGGRKISYKGEEVTVAYAMHEEYGGQAGHFLTKPHVGLLISPQKTFWRSFETVKKLDWTIVDVNEKDLRIEATDRSLWFGRISDIVIRVRPAGAIGSRVDVRSESRDGALDHGRNAARLKQFFSQFRF